MVKKSYEVEGIFKSKDELDQAVNELFVHGFDQSSLSVLSDKIIIHQNFQKKLKDILDLANNSSVSRTFFLAEENIGLAEGAIISVLMYVGTLTAAGIIILKGGNVKLTLTIAVSIGILFTLVGIWLANIIRKHHKEYIENQLKKGGLLLWVQLKNKSQLNIVKAVLEKNNAINVHLNRYIAYTKKV